MILHYAAKKICRELCSTSFWCIQFLFKVIIAKLCWQQQSNPIYIILTTLKYTTRTHFFVIVICICNHRATALFRSTVNNPGVFKFLLNWCESQRVCDRRKERERLKETERTYCTSVSRCTAVGCVTKALSSLRVSTQWGQTVIPPGY